MANWCGLNERDKFGDDGLLFLNETGHSIHFILLISNATERDELKRKIENRLGCVATSTEDIGPHSLILTDFNNKNWNHDKYETFKMKYIIDCFEKKKILDINKYKWDVSKIHKKHFNYSDVIFDRVYTWDTIPDEYLKKSTNTEKIGPESDNDSNDSFLEIDQESYNSKPSKRTREPYSVREKEAIVKYIVERKLYDKVKGVEIWKELERLDWCPKRTWQSMKEHALKSISKEINSFKWLTPKQNERLKKALMKPKQN